MIGLVVAVGGMALLAVFLGGPRYRRRQVRHGQVKRVRKILGERDWSKPIEAAPQEPPTAGVVPTTHAGGRHHAAEPTPRISRARYGVVLPLSPSGSTTPGCHRRAS